MSVATAVVHLCDVDLLLRELSDTGARARLAKLGLAVEGTARIETIRARLASAIERRWTVPYERARQRYGRGVAAVRDRVCQGCFVTLPTCATPHPESGDSLALCSSCGRLLYWA